MNTVKIGKTGESVEIDFAALPEVSRAHVIAYGLTQYLNDSHASVKIVATDADGRPVKVDGKSVPLTGEALAKALAIVRDCVTERVDGLKSGVLKATRVSGGRAAVDPIANEARRLAMLIVKKRDAYAALVKSSGKPSSDEVIAYIKAELSAIMASSKVQTLAARNVADMEALAE